MHKRSFAGGVVALGMTLALVGASAVTSKAAAPGNEEATVQIGFDIAPVPLNLQGKNRALVGKGSYLVNAVGGCNDCHTWNAALGSNFEAGGDPFQGQPEQIYRAGYLAGGRPFGPFTSRNLTPDASGDVADGFETFKLIMRTGFDTEHLTPVLQVMPWPMLRHLSDNDLRAIYEYLTSIPCVEGTPGERTNDTHRCG
jgi:hypothetical protein